MIEIEVMDKSRSIISHFWIEISDKMIICSANVFDLISWMWGSTPDRCYYQQMSVRCFSSSKRLWHAFIRHTVTEIPGNFIFSYTHPETACTSSPHKYKHHIITSSSCGSGLTVAFVERYQSGMGTWWLWNLRGTHLRASASHRTELRSGKLWWMSRPSWLQRPRDQPLSSEPWEPETEERRSHCIDG